MKTKHTATKRMDIITAVIAAPDMPTPNVKPNSWISCFPDSDSGGVSP